MPLFIGIDLGTSGVRACVIDAQGHEVASQRVPLPPSQGTGTAREQVPERWWRAVEEALAGVLEGVPAGRDRRRVAALAVDGTSGSVLLCDAAGAPLTPGLMYDDGRAVEEARRIAALAPAGSAAHGTGSGLAKLLHLLLDHPQAHRVLNQADWIAGRLTGAFGVSDENNALKLGYDPQARDWPAWLDTLGVPRPLLPRVVPAGHPLAPLAPAVAARFGLPGGVLVVAGTTDSTAAFLASGARRPGEAMTALGSTLVVKILSERPVSAPELGVYSHPLGGLWLVGGGSNSGGAVLAAHFTPQRMAELTPLLDPATPTGLDYYPLLRPGERFPCNDPRLAPRLTPRPPEEARFFQGLLEGIAAIEAEAYATLERLGAPRPTVIRTTGGGAANPAWSAIRARLLGVPLEPPLNGEAAYGAALLARRGWEEGQGRSAPRP